MRLEIPARLGEVVKDGESGGKSLTEDSCVCQEVKEEY